MFSGIKRFIVVLPLLFGVLAISNASANPKYGLPDFTELVEELSPAVVNISTTQKVSREPVHSFPHDRKGPGGIPFDDFLRRFFGDQFDEFKEYDAKSLGSGFIISKDGYLLTNYHVVNESDEVIVRLSDKREFIAEVIGSDERSDIALLKIDADDDLPVVKIGKSSTLKVGEWALAIGSPFGFDYTVTAGIVSAKGRSLPSENYIPFIQTDVAINPGNSGGPLFNLDGEVIGVNAQIYSRSGGFMGLSFAIPIDVAMNVVDQLKTTGHVTRGWLGILIQDVTRELAESFGMDKPVGALVAQILPDSPAGKAGLKVGDIIVEFDHKVVQGSSELPPVVGSTKVGDEIDIKVIRNGKAKSFKVRIGELPVDDDEIHVSGLGNKKDVEIDRLDIVVSDLGAEQTEALDDDISGVYVERVSRGPAAKAGIRGGDIILMINNSGVKNSNIFKEMVKELPENRSIPVLIQRSEGPVFLAIKITKDD